MNGRTVQTTVKWLRENHPDGEIFSDSRAIVPSTRNGVFFAYEGDSADGRHYIADAIRNGAVAVVYESEGFAWHPEWQIPHIGVTGLKENAGPITSAFYGEPANTMLTIAVTGTNGKTSCTQWMGQALSRLGRKTAVIGTLGITVFENGVGGEPEVTGYTTPDQVQLQRHLAHLRADGVTCVAMEASSIGIDQGRLNGLPIDIVMFTNFTRDHLDYHHDMAAYRAAKRRLFDWPGLKHAVLNLDDAMGRELANELAGRISLTGYTLETMDAGIPTLSATDIQNHDDGVDFTIHFNDRSSSVSPRLVGRFNISNVLGVLGVLLASGVDWQDAIASVDDLQPPPGRMQRMGGKNAPLVVIDFAHTPDAMEKGLETLRQVVDARQGKLWCVFGCGGNRDPGKRPQMGAVAEQADKVVVTSDNPRSEEPEEIIRQIAAGMKQKPTVIPDRAAAIQQVVAGASANDVIFLAGKGHETYQEIKGKKYPFLDADHVQKALDKRQQDDKRAGIRAFLSQIQSWVEGSRMTADAVFNGISTDTRKLMPGSLFVALKGENFDAHDFLPELVGKGAAAVVAERLPDNYPLPALVVPDTRLALSQIATGWRNQFDIPVIGVTGSNGKTTTKEMTASILRAAFGEGFLATAGNLNNDIGVPMTLFRLDDCHHAAVIEMGVNHPGEMTSLTMVACPTVALVNNAQREHQEFFDGIEASARENGSAISLLPANGVAVFPADEAYTSLWCELAGGRRVVTFGFSEDADVSADYREQDGLTEMNLTVGSETVAVRLTAQGRHNVRNAMAAAASAYAAGMGLDEIVRGLEAFRPVKGRLERKRAFNGALLIDDTYNANPDSVRAAVDVLADSGQHSILVLGDMGEVGKEGVRFHEEVGAYAKERGISRLLGFGEMAKAVVKAFGPGAQHFERLDELNRVLGNEVTPDSVVLVKGSRFMKMERVVEPLMVKKEGC